MRDIIKKILGNRGNSVKYHNDFLYGLLFTLKPHLKMGRCPFLEQRLHGEAFKSV
jgi:hypothetical protein